MDALDQFHHSIRKRFGESLSYFFVALGPTYERKKVIPVLSALFEREGVKARAFFEVYGEVDFIVRAWIPSTRLSDFSAVLEEFLQSRGCGVKRIDQFIAASNPYHWLFSAEPKPQATLPNGNVEYLDELSVADINAALFSDSKSDVVLETLRKLNLVKRATAASGIRFFVAIPAPRESVNTILMNGLISDIAVVLSRQVLIKNATLYRAVTGQKICALAEGIAALKDYAAINDAVDAINDIGLERFGIKTVTYLATEPSEDGRDGLGVVASSAALISPKDIRDLSYYLEAEESEVFERKGTLGIDVNRYLATGEIRENPALTREVLETIVAFLNSQGGELLIGALEPDRFRGEMRKVLEEKFPLDEALRICGVEWEYTHIAKRPDWESYSNRLYELCGARIAESVNAYIRIHQLHSSTTGRDLCLVRVQSLPPGDFAYYEDDGFFMRSGAATRPLRGRAREDYQRRRQRRDLF